MLLPLLLSLPLTQDPAGLDRITVPAVRADVQFLSDPVLGGRGTPSAGLEIAAAYLEARFRRLGLSPAGEQGFRQALSLVHRRIDPAATLLTIEVGGVVHRLVFGADYYPERLAHLVPWTSTGELVSAGSGQGPEVDPLDLEGKWVVLFEGGPLKMRPALQRAAAAGAAGAIITPAPIYGGNPYASRFADTATKMLDGITTRPGRDLAGPDLPVVTMSRGSWLVIEELAGRQHVGDEPPEAGTAYGATVLDRRALVDPDQPASNVIARLEGQHPDLAKEVIVVMAHYDGAGTLGGQHHPGADDNASGTAALLAVAEALVAHGGVGRSVLFAATAGNGQGNLGAEHFAATTGLGPDEQVVMLVELDSLGNGPPDGIQVGPGPTSTWHTEWVGRFTQAAAAEQFPVVQDADSPWARSEARQVVRTLKVAPVLVSGGRHARHRTIDDRIQSVHMGKVVRATRAVARLVLEAGG
jgi:aminopeptidase YwaD